MTLIYERKKNLICVSYIQHRFKIGINILPLRDLICAFPYGADEKLPQKMKQVGGMEA